MGDSGPYMVLTKDDELLRTFQQGRGFQPIGNSFSGSPLRGPHVSLNDGSLTREVTSVLANMVRRSR